jgi:hypothetical protein
MDASERICKRVTGTEESRFPSTLRHLVFSGLAHQTAACCSLLSRRDLYFEII